MSSKLMGNTSLPNYVKIVATAILACTYVAALWVAIDVYISQGPQGQLPTIVAFVLGTGLSMALSAVGMHQGASLLEAPSPAQATQPVAQPAAPAPTGGASNDGSGA